VRYVVAAVFLVTALAPQPGTAASCDYKVGETVRITGTYVPGKPDYTRSFVFALQLECGPRDLITVQRATGGLPVCKPQDQVEVVGKLVLSKFLIDRHYEIDNPSGVTCLPATELAAAPQGLQASAPSAPAAPPPSATPTAPAVLPQGAEAQAPAQTVPPTKTAPAATSARTAGPSAWVGRYQDSRGAGDVTFTLTRGTSMVSGTWKLRTGGGGPVTGLLDETGLRMQIRMENTAPECPGIFQGSAEINDTLMVATYRGTDCVGPVLEGKLELRPQ
jgi:hypothetical protein